MTTIAGHCEPRFAAVGEAFAANFAAGSEIGAAVCVMVDGEVVVDLTGGYADAASGERWSARTLAPIWSCTRARWRCWRSG